MKDAASEKDEAIKAEIIEAANNYFELDITLVKKEATAQFKKKYSPPQILTQKAGFFQTGGLLLIIAVVLLLLVSSGFLFAYQYYGIDWRVIILALFCAVIFIIITIISVLKYQGKIADNSFVALIGQIFGMCTSLLKLANPANELSNLQQKSIENPAPAQLQEERKSLEIPQSTEPPKTHDV